jgi:hypothetical protein
MKNGLTDVAYLLGLYELYDAGFGAAAADRMLERSSR